jgi:hypothetical protein
LLPSIARNFNAIYAISYHVDSQVSGWSSFGRTFTYRLFELTTFADIVSNFDPKKIFGP